MQIEHNDRKSPNDDSYEHQRTDESAERLVGYEESDLFDDAIGLRDNQLCRAFAVHLITASRLEFE